MNTAEIKQYLSSAGNGLLAIGRMGSNRKIDTIWNNGNVIGEPKLADGAPLGFAERSQAFGSTQVSPLIEKVSQSFFPSRMTYCPRVQHAVRRDQIWALPSSAVPPGG